MRVFQSTNSIIACLSGATWRTEWTYHHSLTCSSIHHISFLSERISLKQTHTRPHTAIKNHKRSRCSKQRTTFQSIQFNICAEWTLPCVGIRTRPMGSSTFVLIYLYTHAFVDKSDRGADLNLEHSVAKNMPWIISAKFGCLLCVSFVYPTRRISVSIKCLEQINYNSVVDKLVSVFSCYSPCCKDAVSLNNS